MTEKFEDLTPDTGKKQQKRFNTWLRGGHILFTDPATRVLLSAIPIPDLRLKENRERIILEGDVPRMLNPRSGYNFHMRCPIAGSEYSQEIPLFRDIGDGYEVAYIKVYRGSF